MFDHIAANCAMFASRRLSRSITRLYDAALSPSGLRATQYNVLVAIARGKGVSMTELGAVLGMDRTTLTHALRSLVQQQLVEDTEAPDARVRRIVLTDRGRECAAAAVPMWRRAQDMVEGALGGAPEWRDLNKRLRSFNRAIPATGGAVVH